MSLISVSTPKCCNDNDQCYLIEYKFSIFDNEKIFSICSKCLLKIKCFSDDISKIFCINCNQDITENILKIISETPIKKEFVN